MRLPSELLRQGYGKIETVIEVVLSQMLNDDLEHDHIQWHPQSIIHYIFSWPCGHFTEFRKVNNRCGMLRGDLYSSGHLLSVSFGSCIFFFIFETNHSKICDVFQTLNYKNHRYFFFISYHWLGVLTIKSIWSSRECYRFWINVSTFVNSLEPVRYPYSRCW